MPETESELVVFSGNSNKPLVKDICEYLEIPIGSCEVGKFSDGEIQIEIAENVRGRDVFLVQSTSTPVNDHLMELLIMIDAARRASAASITAVVPYFGYARQDARWLLERRSRPAWLPISSPRRAPTASFRWTCTPGRSRAFSTCPLTTCTPRPSSSRT